jgi:hypothetical protein
LDSARLSLISERGALMSAIPTSPSPPPTHHDQTAAKGTRESGKAARDEAFQLLNIWRPHLIAKFQHRVLDYLLEHGTLFAPDLADDFVSPPDIRRVYVGAAVHTLARRRLIRKTGELRFTMQAGRHGSYFPVWTLAVDGAAVTEWRSSNPIPPEPETSD